MNALLQAYPDCPPWFELGLSYAGMRELLPDGSLEPRVRALFEHTHFPAKLVNAQTAWCSAFACTLLELSGFRSPRSAAARDFLAWGRDTKPVVGAFCVMPRGDDPKQAHVTMYGGDAGPGYFLGFGGNQKNSVCMQTYPLLRILGCRLPSERPV